MNADTIQGCHQGRGGGPAFHSRLEPFVDLIRESRRQRKTWREIVERLRIEKGCAITVQGLHQFYRRYVTRRAQPHWENNQKPEVVPPAHPNEPAIRPEPASKPVLAATPVSRPYRKPKLENTALNDPTKL